MRPHIFSFSWLCFKIEEIKCIRIPLVSQNNNKKSLWSRHCHFHLNVDTDVGTGRHSSSLRRNVRRVGMFRDTSVIFSPLPPPQWWPSPDITCVVVAELGRKCWWNLKWCWKAELEIEVMSAYPHGNNPAYIAIFYENAMCRISSKCNMVNIFSNVINITLIMSSKIYFACCKSHMIEIFRICIQLPFLISLAISLLWSSLLTFVWPEFN